MNWTQPPADADARAVDHHITRATTPLGHTFGVVPSPAATHPTSTHFAPGRHDPAGPVSARPSAATTPTQGPPTPSRRTHGQPAPAAAYAHADRPVSDC